MKIVKFKDGKYGVRRWSWFSGYQFYMMGNGLGLWVSMSGSDAPWIKVDSIVAAKDRVKNIKLVEANNNDKGVPI